MALIAIGYGLEFTCQAKGCSFRAKKGELLDTEKGCPDCAAKKAKRSIRVARERNTHEPTRKLQLVADEVAEERHSRMDLHKSELVEMIECLETQNDRFKGYLNDYELIQKSDRAQLAAAEREAKYARYEKQWVFGQTVQAMAEVVMKRPSDAERVKLAMDCIHATEALLNQMPVYDGKSSPLEASANNSTRSAFRALCRFAVHLPRPGTKLATLYQLVAEDHFDELPDDLAWHTIVTP